MTEVTYCQMWWTCPTREELLKKPRGWELTFPWGCRGGIQQDLPVCKWSPDQSTLPNNEQGFQSTYKLLKLFHCPHCHMTTQKPNFDRYAFYTTTKPAIKGCENMKTGWQLLLHILLDIMCFWVSPSSESYDDDVKMLEWARSWHRTQETQHQLSSELPNFYENAQRREGKSQEYTVKP